MSAPIDGERGEPTLVVWERARGEVFELEYAEGATFVVDGLGTEVWASWSEALTVDDAATYLLGPVLGFLLRLRGTVCLHASGVVVGDRAIALLGPAEAGKSTTAAAFAKLGYPVLSDDLLALSDTGGTWVVEAGYPGLRLWPDSVGPLLAHDDPVDLAAFCGRILDDFHTLTPSGASVARRLDG